MGILDLEAAKGGPFRFTLGGVPCVLPDPAEMSLQEIVTATRTDGLSLTDVRMPFHKAKALVLAWCKHYDLGTPADIDRLLYLLDRYDKHIEYDLQHFAGEDLVRLWQGRRWRRLLNLIDHLPRHSYYSDAVANDEEHARLLAKAQAERKAQGEEEKPWSPPMTMFTPEVTAIADLIDSVAAMHHTLRLVNSDPKKKQPAPPEPYRRPVTALAGATKRAQFEARKAKHEALVARLLPHKKQADKT